MKPFVKLFRRVLPKSSKTVNNRIDTKQIKLMDDSSSSHSIPEKDRTLEPTSSCSSTDIKALEDQIENLKAVVENLKEEVESKEIGIAKLAREKEKLSLDLIKQKRSNTNILKQLEDERKFYFHEKEIYCQEMNELKELKKN
ncbi:hypothetical protein HHI36_008843 [Cryptolaemus montrouzieri]|uniref:Uncharacterized protein n=1 Tax=Cryptolaemus montrouzieri TaxID=559131 RepID=A0ABD2MTR0_9CUCU